MRRGSRCLSLNRAVASQLVCDKLPGAAVPGLFQPHSDLDGRGRSTVWCHKHCASVGGLLGLVLTQMMMLFYCKKATSEVQLPLALCRVQFATSALLAAAICAVRTGRLPWSPRELWTTISSLAGVWTAGLDLQRKHGGHEPFTRDRRSLHGAVGNNRPRLRYG
jgi:hypothetical protein